MQSVNEQSEPLVSVVIATYNMAQYLPAAIESVLAQTWKNLEVIVVDDGSEDDTEHQMQRFYGDKRVRYIRTENRGQPKAKNLGVKSSSGDFLAFCDADDLWQSDKLQRQMPLFELDQIGVVYSDVSYVGPNGEKVNKLIQYQRYRGIVIKELLIKNFIPFGTAVVRKRCFQDCGYFDENLPMGIDWDLWLRLSLHWQFEFLPETTYIYRVWPGQMSNNYRGRYENAIIILRKFFKNNPGIVSNRLQSRAWSDMYSSKAISIASSERIFFEPLVWSLKGVMCDLFYYPAWKSLAKLLLRRI
ncbi:glycosyltransferase family 2 protein [Marinobacter alexandrii]|uniref:glycosyltransferase family 2 protein n=1 Tax=Marinobacter alexandrii TaxID=2570351 RepID=UPI001108BA24|nr:glycosyltransferase [Marinobacter alexandrii]